MSGIGVFDSGLGGLTVLKALVERLPEENFIYLGDTARLPYGIKSRETVKRYVAQNIQALLQRNVKAIVVACNSASSVLVGDNSPSFPVPVYNVIEPGSRLALDVSHSGKIGILATRTTVKQEAYLRTLKSMEPACEVFQQACPLLVPLVEEGWINDPLTNLIVHRYVAPLAQKGIDTIILGCTHYPLLKETVAKVTGSGIALVDSAVAVSELIRAELENGTIPPASGPVSGYVEILTTDVSEHFEQVARNIMYPYPVTQLKLTDL